MSKTPPHKLATSSVMFEDLPIEQVCEAVSRLGFTGLDIWAPFEKCTHLQDIRKRLGGNGLRELMVRHDLDLAAFTLYDEARLSQYWELIRDFGGGVIVRSSEAGRLTDPKELIPRMRVLFEQLKPDIELAEKCNARLAIENYGGEVLSSADTFAQMPGLGAMEFTPWMRALAEIDYAQYSCIFMHGHPPGDEMEASLSESRDYLLKIEDSLN